MRQRARPFAALHALGFERHVAARRHDQGKRELGRRNRRIAGAGRDRNPERGAGRKVDHLGVSPDQRDEPEFRQPFEQRAGKFDPFANRDDHVGIAQALDELVQIPRRLTIAHDVVMADQREAFEPIDDILVVVGDDDFHESGEALPVRWFSSSPANAGDPVITEVGSGARLSSLLRCGVLDGPLSRAMTTKRLACLTPIHATRWSRNSRP